MTLRQTVAESLQQLQAWIAFLESERQRLQSEITRIQARDAPTEPLVVPEPSPEEPPPSAPVEEDDGWL